ncbi:DnaJ domain containing protein [Ceratobasidium theobromae]|uniref:DnaJ domain containing protein n=1 Tax=Ceratobasidium theobromae TaxID=1582974 RepID=A0A5N5QL03_9AGAM|nr:DnaJ domain containing protein [Ceratobasidium theobromae]
MPPTDSELDAYEILGLTIEATEKDIKSTYRKLSLKVHPDRHPNNPEAAAKFHELNQAYELLLDPVKRSALDASRKIKLARAERFAAYDSKRRGLQEELEERERAFKKARVEKAKAEQAMQEEVERLGEEGRRRRKEKEETMARKTEEEQKSQQKASAPGALGEPTIGPHDTTVRLKYKLATYPTLTTAPALASHLAVFGTVDTGAIVISLKANKKQPEKPPKFATALVPFEKAGDAYACLCSAGKAGRGLEGVEVTWVTEDEPEIIKWLRTQGKPGASINASGDTDGPFASFPSNSSSDAAAPMAFTHPGLDFESVTLMRMRQLERERLEREILEQEAAEE